MALEKVPFVYYFHKTLSGNHVETVIGTQSAPNGVSQNFAGALLNELQLAPKSFFCTSGGAVCAERHKSP